MKADFQELDATAGQAAYGPGLATVLVVDLDGTLTFTDTLHELAIGLLKDKPLLVFALPLWLAMGKAALKARLAATTSIDASTLPYNDQLLAWLKTERASGRSIALCTAADRRVAQQVADHLQVFDEVIASDGSVNVTGKAKRAALEAKFGSHGYDYAGNASADVAVWAGARRAILANARPSVAAQAAKVADVAKQFPRERADLRQWVKLIRAHQWLKNLLLFVPLLAAHQLGDLATVGTLALAFVAFSLCASAVYVTNDLLDLESDRRHPRKRHRPLASGAVPIAQGAALVPVLLALSVLVGAFVGADFLGWLGLYFVVTTLYSLHLKRIPLVDCLTLAALYTLRVIAGGEAAEIELSFWLLAFCVFIFLSLAFVKRYAELQVEAQAHGKRAHGRGYEVADANLLQTLGIAAGYASVMVLALYLNSDTVAAMYEHPRVIWLAIPLMLLWVSRAWMKAHRAEMHDDPVVFAIKDRGSLAIVAMIALAFVLAAGTADWVWQGVR
ncbi:UbiA family prenyltransferase [Ramlibacter algicola]|uniref:UbiA family prenyltransferase n=1 Tax=Ramlibacter algicola TaxID=2795217 RepID=A0A934USI3_9BURK|nr:UbiA family prenyltransferase [Ramlibacter algicola]MBK0393758.1 UbiA family prenyltransferase [Ramlibacter algicola]